MRKILVLALGLAPFPALADPLRELEPLLQVFAADGDSPGWDVAGIRCAGLIFAQDAWQQEHGGPGPTRYQLRQASVALDQAVQHRIGLGQDLTKATLSVQADLQRVQDLYLARFAENDRAGQAWDGDPLLVGDANYCKAALG